MNHVAWRIDDNKTENYVKHLNKFINLRKKYIIKKMLIDRKLWHWIWPHRNEHGAFETFTNHLIIIDFNVIHITEIVSYSSWAAKYSFIKKWRLKSWLNDFCRVRNVAVHFSYSFHSPKTYSSIDVCSGKNATA